VLSRARKSGILLQHLNECRAGFSISLQFLKDECAVIKRRNVPRSHRIGVIITIEGVFQTPKSEQDGAAIVESFRLLRAERCSTIKPGQGFV